VSDTSDFGTFGRFVETPVDQMPPEMKQAYEFTHRLRGMLPGPHKIWLANPRLSQVIVPTGAYYQTDSTLTKAVTGRWRAPYANYEHEKIAVEDGGLAPGKVGALISGQPVSFDDERQQVAYELASTLVVPRYVPLGLYQRAKGLLGDAGIVDVTVLIGWFTAVSMTLAAFDVPANAIGLDQ
jgi:4-carboxymuconolactone decarboxylase